MRSNWYFIVAIILCAIMWVAIFVVVRNLILGVVP